MREPMASRRRDAIRGARVAAIALALATGHAAAQPAPPSTQAPEVITPPRPVTPLHADYPAEGTGDATVVLVITVNADGSVRSARPADGAPEPFASAAMAASSGWRFEPATRNGKPIAAKIRAEIQFTAPPPEPTPAPAPDAPAKPIGSAPPPPPPLEVTVHGEVPAPGVTSLTRAEVRLLPGAFGDPFRAVEMLPGVTPLASGVPFFYVRGAPPGNVGYYLDGIRVPLLYHIGLGPSVVHPAIVDHVDLHPGGYPARFGRYAGGIVSGETRDPLPEWHGEASIRLVDSGAMLEGPLGDRGSFFVSGRVSYTGLLLSAISSSIDLGYWDYSARATVHLTPRDDLTIFAFGARDYLGDRDDETKETRTLFNTTFHRIDLRYDHRFGGPEDRVRQAITLGIDHTGFDKGSGVSDRMIAARTEITKRASPAVLVRAGLDAQADSYSADLAASFPDAGGFTSLFSGRTDLAMGARADAVINVTSRFEVTPGLRLDFFSSRGDTAIALNPRLAARLAITKALRLVQAHGFASQTPSFILPGPGFQPSLAGGLQHSFQMSAGLEADLPLDVTASATFFRNAFFSMTDALGTSPVPGSGDNFPDRFDRRSLGSSIGLEVTVRRRLTKTLGGFVSYTLSRSERYLDRSRIASSFDRTHVLNAAISGDFGKGYRVGTRIVFYSGYPITLAAPPSFDLRQTGRLQPFFRFDWRAEKRWRVSRGWISLVLEMQNSMLAKETLQQQCGFGGTDCQPVRIGPVTIPSIGLEGGF
ncbi:TonB family protein / TonB-dependent receptor [Minicystis rosea]|nr:TonB family protein / TonB-dependent receptor [Minicystis rosea]